MHVRVERSARVALVGGGGVPPAEVWYLLHGYAQLARRFLARFSGIAGPRRLLVAPEGLSRFYVRPGDESREGAQVVGASWMTREDRLTEIADYVRYLDRVVEEIEESDGLADGTAVPVAERTVVGFSQGVHTAVRWVVSGEATVDRLVLWGGSLPEDLPEDALSSLEGVRLVFVRGASDPLRRKAEELRDEAWLKAQGIPFEVLGHPGGHTIDPALLSSLAGG